MKMLAVAQATSVLFFSDLSRNLIKLSHSSLWVNPLFMLRCFQHCVLWLLLSWALLSCEFAPGDEDPMMAQVFDKKLFASEVNSVVPETMDSTDRILARNAYVDRWIKENVMLHEAEKNIPADLQIDKLVKDYQASLIMLQYEKSVVESLLDTVISDAELEAYYDANKSQYQLESTIVRCHLIKFPRSLDDKTLKKIDSSWKGNKDSDFRDLVSLSTTFAETYYLSDSIWYKLDVISQEMPKGSISLNAIRNNKVFQLTNDDYYYFLKILDVKDKTEIAPLAFIQEQASRVILHKRKIALLEKLREDLYQRAVSRNNIKIFTQ
ncbi:MAG: peptidyl-prolyl cis-trans isomerase [Saprospiraceae bacterium]|nr:peptidyl-prolyl cis-trans isomerase [Saprospiraceae bacterium]